jgi:transglutaminase-like putative cysteine protease
MLLRIDHETRLTYTEPVIEAVMEVRMSPPSTEDQTVLGYKMRLTPSVPITSFRDGFGNRAELINIIQPHAEVIMRASSCVRIHRRPIADRLLDADNEPVHGVILDTIEFLRPTPLTQPCDELKAFAKQFDPIAMGFPVFVDALMAKLRSRIQYEKKVTGAFTPVSEVLKLGRGVCQDFAHLMIATCRLLGIPTRYVSGYIHQPGELATHAWCQLWAGNNIGWVDVDPTHQLWVENDHVCTAYGRDFNDVAPNKGVYKGNADETISVMVNVQPVDQVPPDLLELTSAPAWTSTIVNEMMRQQSRNALIQQYRKQAYRQQQSQQQQ